MPRPKGSKNKPKTVKATVDFATQIAERRSENQEGRAEIHRQGNRQNRSQKDQS